MTGSVVTNPCQPSTRVLHPVPRARTSVQVPSFFAVRDKSKMSIFPEDWMTSSEVTDPVNLVHVSCNSVPELGPLSSYPSFYSPCQEPNKYIPEVIG